MVVRNRSGSKILVDDRTASMPTVVFDGDCGFCTWSVNQSGRWLRPRVRFVPWQRADLTQLGLTAEACREAVQIVLPGPRVRSGGRAVAETLTLSRQPWPALGRLLRLPGLSQLNEWLYRRVAANRHRLPGSTPACHLHAPIEDRPRHLRP